MKLAHDHWFTFDKLEHIGGGILFYFLAHWLFWTAPNYWVFIISIQGAHVWELKDSRLSWKKWGGFGGDGYSFKDLAASILGAGFAWWLWTLRF